MSRRPNDKIFDNKFNIGEIQPEIYKGVSIETTYKNYLDNNDTSYNIMRLALDTDFLQEWKKTEWYPDKKIEKTDLSEIFIILNKVTKKYKEFSRLEKFIFIAEFINVPVDVLYEMVSTKYKEIVLIELNDKYKILQKEKIYGIF